MAMPILVLAPSPSLLEASLLGDVAELEELIPELKEVSRKLRLVKEMYCRPLLIVEAEKLKEYFTGMLQAFTYHFSSIIAFTFSGLLLRPEGDVSLLLRRLMKLERENFSRLKWVLEEKSLAYNLDPHSIVEMHAAVVDCSLWAISSTLENGLQGFLDKLSKRAGRELAELVSYLHHLMYVVLAIDLVLLEDASHHRDVLETLVSWGSSYADEVESYLDTLSLLISDESYKALADYMEG